MKNDCDQKKTIGFLQESPLLPVSPSVRRAMKMAKDALQERGFKVVPFELTAVEWQEGRDFMQGIMTNGITPRILIDLAQECETLMNHITVQIKTLDQSAAMKWLQTFFQPSDDKNGRSIEAMRALYTQSPR